MQLDEMYEEHDVSKLLSHDRWSSFAGGNGGARNNKSLKNHNVVAKDRGGELSVKCILYISRNIQLTRLHVTVQYGVCMRAALSASSRMQGDVFRR